MKTTRLVAVATLAAAIAGAGAGTAGAGADPVTLTFQSLAFQEATVAASDAIVAAWNEANPDVQVELRQGSWDNVNDELVTQFAGGSAPDIIHFESASLGQFAQQGYLADLSGLLSEETMSAVSEDVWGTVTTPDGAIIAAPTLMQSYVVFANLDAFEAAGVEVPAGDTLTWDDFQALAASLTTDDQAGLGWGLKSPTATIMNLALGFGGDFFAVDGEDVTFEAGAAEMEVPSRIHAMAYEDGSLDQLSLSLTGGDALAGFTAGDYAMYVSGNFNAQTLTVEPPDFAWDVLPPLAGSESANQAANPQTLSVSAESEQHRGGRRVHRLLHERRQPRGARRGRLADPCHGGCSRGRGRLRPAVRTGGTRSSPAATISSPPRSSPFCPTRSGRMRSPRRRSRSSSPTRSLSRISRPNSRRAGTTLQAEPS